MPPIDSWMFVWQMQKETLEAAWERLTLYWPGERARRGQKRERDREEMLEKLREWDAISGYEVTLDNPPTMA